MVTVAPLMVATDVSDEVYEKLPVLFDDGGVITKGALPICLAGTVKVPKVGAVGFTSSVSQDIIVKTNNKHSGMYFLKNCFIAIKNNIFFGES